MRASPAILRRVEPFCASRKTANHGDTEVHGGNHTLKGMPRFRRLQE